MADDDLAEIKFVLGTLVNSLTVREENLIGHKDYQRIKSIVSKWNETREVIINEYRSEQARTSADKKSPGD